MDARRLELYELLKPKLDEEAATKLVLALPSDPDRTATKDDLESSSALLLTHVDRVNESLRNHIDRVNESLRNHIDTQVARLEATLTRRMVTIMGAWTILVGSAFGWAAALLR